ncbi:hypothetical protein M9H77_25958 [Catharanthus roseus]|uniref:Uncharacterized protein n=1 Tax=Catharanthus roseus TaxID=4058 RepID=A0ACC0A9U7_CATRO|nr:hypothetical protein M9H77_25958 [Catharanthus roseus]
MESRSRRMASSLAFLLAAISLPLLLPESMGLTSPISSQTDSEENHDSLIFQIQEANLKLARLESGFDRHVHELNAKSVYIRQSEKKIQEMNQEIDRLRTALKNLEDNTSSANDKIHALEEQIQFLWAASRKKNFEIYKLEIRAHDAEKRLKLVRIQVEKMADIVSEQWTQIQQLEQALQMAQFRASKVKRQLTASKCPVMKSIRNSLEHLETLKGLLDHSVSDVGSVLKSCISEASYHLRKTYTAAKYYHHQLQGYIKQAMLRNELTAVLANDELVFLVVSALITFPVLSLYMLLSSGFS